MPDQGLSLPHVTQVLAGTPAVLASLCLTMTMTQDRPGRAQLLLQMGAPVPFSKVQKAYILHLDREAQYCGNARC